MALVVSYVCKGYFPGSGPVLNIVYKCMNEMINMQMLRAHCRWCIWKFTSLFPSVSHIPFLYLPRSSLHKLPGCKLLKFPLFWTFYSRLEWCSKYYFECNVDITGRMHIKCLSLVDKLMMSGSSIIYVYSPGFKENQAFPHRYLIYIIAGNPLMIFA